MEDSFYVPIADHRFASTDHTRGPWGPDSQHAGPPAALLGRAIERHDGVGGRRVARITFDILKPIPVATLAVSVRTARPGKRVDLVEANLTAEDELIMRASAWRIHAGDHSVDIPVGPPAPPGPETTGPEPAFASTYEGYLQAMEARFVKGAFLEPGPAVAWMRMRYPLLPDEEPSPLTRVLSAADSASGISAELDWGKWLFVNPDLSVYLQRMPIGEWICFDAATTAEGIGLAASVIYDENGHIGRTLQSLYIAPRRGDAAS